MKYKKLWVIVAVLFAVIGGTAYFWPWQTPEDIPSQVATSQAAPVLTPPPTVVTASPVQHPLDPPLPTKQLPSLDASDTVLSQLLAGLLGEKSWRTLFVHEGIIRHIVATIDNLPRQIAPVKMWPVHPVGGWLATTGDGASLSIAPENAGRYAIHVALLRDIDIPSLAMLYRDHYPLFQQAYVDLGYPQGYFNDRLIFAIDDLLATPEPEIPPQLIQEKVHYRFASPDLDRRSAGQKIMLRIGIEHARLVKQKLAALRHLLAQPTSSQ